MPGTSSSPISSRGGWDSARKACCSAHSRVRYAWDEHFSYPEGGGVGCARKGLLSPHMLHKLGRWDPRPAHGPDMMPANSSYVRPRTRHIYGRDSQVVFPPVALD